MLNAWSATFFPKSTPQALADEIQAMVNESCFADQLPLGVAPFPLGAAQLAMQIRQHHECLGKLIAEIGLKQD